MAPRFTVAPMNTSTPFGPLVALGFFVREHDLWVPVRQRVHFAPPTHTADPVGALFDLGIGILAGCEVVAVLDTCGPDQVDQMRQANETLLRWTGRVYQHNFTHDWLRLDLDLTPLFASARAAGSEKGYFPGEKRHWAPVSPFGGH